MPRPDGGAPAPPAASPSAGGEVRSTLLLPSLLERFDPEQPITVLDVGYGVPETVEYFSRFTCQLHFTGMVDAPELQLLPEEDPEAFFEEVFRRHWDFPPEICFDVCLLWDFLNYLPLPALRAFSRVLRPYLHRQTHAHGFGAFKSTAPAMGGRGSAVALQYGVFAADKLIVRPEPELPAPRFSHSRSVLSESLGCFEIVRGTLLKEGTMELLLQAR